MPPVTYTPDKSIIMLISSSIVESQPNIKIWCAGEDLTCLSYVKRTK